MYPCASVLSRADSSDPRISTPSLLLSSYPRCSLGLFVNNPLSLYFVVILSFPMQLLKNRVGNDSYVERGMQTFNNGQKSKEIQSSKVELHVRNFLMCFF